MAVAEVVAVVVAEVAMVVKTLLLLLSPLGHSYGQSQQVLYARKVAAHASWGVSTRAALAEDGPAPRGPDQMLLPWTATLGTGTVVCRLRDGRLAAGAGAAETTTEAAA